MAGLTLPALCQASPVYLECFMTNGTKPVLWNITLDESLGSASYVISSMDVARKESAVFTANNVVFSSMEISRTDLSFKRTTDFLGKTTVDIGQCKVAPKAAERKF
ncbi:hypothetical protein CEC48_00070 [Pseudomonas sp. K2I15]|nr:hypothetical protein CEC48_00070 [Pseudomonas sp. K2I15]